MITLDDGSNESRNATDADLSSLHLHSVTTPHNHGRIFWSPAPGFAIGVGSIRESFLPYEESDTFISTDASVTWQMRRDAQGVWR
ncbi:uncharacterized protein LACBIDRAFT_313495 [Laccaria bicolor S238N-H82]|uniref:Predicted protein n=1 Tax=Laccaria bicolor (strain S238N-H82 / ATCC MYA-4686) TaxID=486041 RepID=B0D050_LACBS|nr:uncharacterized protein LACBIDRAFT_313495 [Laccaria bicolor S238N-H82]EDR11394.1 predicted protein [Laccaria bicolor S238N-H82]|eukprot:XP_001877291.1 predicted protein [Laccaria bicolor S238N-H82]